MATGQNPKKDLKPLVIVFGASGFIGSRVLKCDFGEANVIGLSRRPVDSELLSYQSRELRLELSRSSKNIIINSIQQMPEVGAQSISGAVLGNFIFPKRQIKWIQKMSGKPISVVQLSTYWEDDYLDRGFEQNAYVLAKKSFSLWLRKHHYSFLEIVTGDVIGPGDERGKLIQIAFDRFPEPAHNYLRNPLAEMRLMKVDTVLKAITRKYPSSQRRVKLAPDWMITTSQFVETVYTVRGGYSHAQGVDQDLQDYIIEIWGQSENKKRVPNKS